MAIANLPFLHLRHTAVTELAQAGATAPEGKIEMASAALGSYNRNPSLEGDRDD